MNVRQMSVEDLVPITELKELNVLDHSFELIEKVLDSNELEEEGPVIIHAAVNILHLKNEIFNFKNACGEEKSKEMLENIFHYLQFLEKQEPQLFGNKVKKKDLI